MADVVAELPPAAGAYVLLIRLERQLLLDMPAFRGISLVPGLYAYCGSAYGPGGIRARVSRHLRAGKPMRWHVDRLTAASQIERVCVRIDGRECDLAGELLAGGGSAVLPGFGSTDCRICPAHLLRLPEGEEFRPGLFDLAVLQ